MAMRHADRPLEQRAAMALERITAGLGQMRVPAEASDPDIVISDLLAEAKQMRDMLRRAASVLRPTVGTHGEPCDGAVACGVKQDGYATLAAIDELLRGAK